MADEQLNKAIEQAQHAADAAQSAADSLHQAVQQAQALADVVSVTTGIDPFIFRLAIFVLAVFVGYYVVWSVTPALHTPLMSVTNAISSVIIVGALIATAGGLAEATAATGAARWFGFLAIILASINIFGGFLVTQRMLGMYKKKER